MSPKDTPRPHVRVELLQKEGRPHVVMNDLIMLVDSDGVWHDLSPTVQAHYVNSRVGTARELVLHIISFEIVDRTQP